MLSLALLPGLLLLPAALAPPGVAVSAPARAELRAGGAVRLVVPARCARGQRVFELYVGVRQPSGARAQAYRVPALACDGAWHRLTVTVPTTAGGLRPGPATTQALLLVHTAAGLPTSASDTTAAVLVRA